MKGYEIKNLTFNPPSSKDFHLQGEGDRLGTFRKDLKDVSVKVRHCKHPPSDNATENVFSAIVHFYDKVIVPVFVGRFDMLKGFWIVHRIFDQGLEVDVGTIPPAELLGDALKADLTFGFDP